MVFSYVMYDPCEQQDRQTDSQTERQTKGQTDRQTERERERPTKGRQTDTKNDSRIDKLTPDVKTLRWNLLRRSGPRSLFLKLHDLTGHVGKNFGENYGLVHTSRILDTCDHHTPSAISP
jgi:hypothetical protein